MSIRILRRSKLEPFQAPLPAPLSGRALHGALTRFGQPDTTRLGPGERMIGGRVFYSAAWLGSGVASLQKVKR
jgi:hypothetical protein